jgi:hypothetical protein
LQKVGGLLIGEPVVRTADGRPFPEQGVRLVKKENPVAVFGGGEDLFQIFFRLADIFGYQLGKVDPVDRFIDLFPN